MNSDFWSTSPGHFCAIVFPTALGLMFASCGNSAAQTYSSATMWGVAPTGNAGSGAVDSSSSVSSSSMSSNSAANNLASAALSNYVSAAKAGIILNPNLPSNVTIQAVGSQTIVSNTVMGNNNSTSISGSQVSSNSGSVVNTTLK